MIRSTNADITKRILLEVEVDHSESVENYLPRIIGGKVFVLFSFSQLLKMYKCRGFSKRQVQSRTVIINTDQRSLILAIIVSTSPWHTVKSSLFQFLLASRSTVTYARNPNKHPNHSWEKNSPFGHHVFFSKTNRRSARSLWPRSPATAST